MAALNGRMALVCAALIFAVAFYKVAQQPEAALFKTQDLPQPQLGPVVKHSAFASSKHDVSTHASSLIELHDGNVRAFWFSGSREGAADVEIHTAVFDAQHDKWGEESSIANRADTQQALHRYISKLGNPVPLRAADGSLQLFYVNVSLGGWAGSSISFIVSHDEGMTWSKPQRLITSPFLNISTLVKGMPFLYQDGTVGLPVYHEFIGKFAELLHLDRQGKVLDKQRLATGSSNTLQPVALLQNATDAQMLMRNASNESPRRVKKIATSDGGAHWTAPAVTNLPNPDAAVAAVMLSDGYMLAVVNDIEDGRDTLVMAISNDGSNWKNIYRIEDQRTLRQLPEQQRSGYIIQMLKQSDARFVKMPLSEVAHHALRVQQQVCTTSEHCGFEFSYPFMIQTSRGDIHLSYTWNRRYIKHVRFSAAWLKEQITRSMHD